MQRGVPRLGFLRIRICQQSRRQLPGEKGYTFDTVLNGFAAVVKANDLPKLLTVQGITLVEPDTIVHASEEPQKSKPTKPSTINKDTIVDAQMNTSISFLGIEQLWNEGFEGQGIKVAVLDTGIDADHPEFANIYKGGKNFIPNSSTYAKTRADNDASETGLYISTKARSNAAMSTSRSAGGIPVPGMMPEEGLIEVMRLVKET